MFYHVTLDLVVTALPCLAREEMCIVDCDGSAVLMYIEYSYCYIFEHYLHWYWSYFNLILRVYSVNKRHCNLFSNSVLDPKVIIENLQRFLKT